MIETCPRCGCMGIKLNEWKKEFQRDDYVCLKCGFLCNIWGQYRDIDFINPKLLVVDEQ